jgi:hypothetical protein
MKRLLIPALLLSAALAGGAEAGTVVTVPTDLNPGDQYRLVFVTDGTRDAQSTDIADYNAFVTAQANQSTELQALGVDWFVIGSTSTVSARDNTGTDGGGGVPIYLLENGLRISALGCAVRTPFPFTCNTAILGTATSQPPSTSNRRNQSR